MEFNIGDRVHTLIGMGTVSAITDDPDCPFTVVVAVPLRRGAGKYTDVLLQLSDIDMELIQEPTVP